MLKEFEHPDDDVTPGEIEPTTRDDATAPVGCFYLTFDGDFLTFDDRLMMLEENHG